jgi:hypothetical protein
MVLAGVRALYAATPAATPTIATDSVGPTAVAYSAKKMFLQVGAVEKIQGTKFLLRKKADTLEFYINDSAKIFYHGQADLNYLKEGQFVAVKGARNSNTMIASSVSIYNEMDVYRSTKDDESDDKSGSVSGSLLGTVIKRESDCDEFDKMYGKPKVDGQPDASAPHGDSSYNKPFFVRTNDNRIFMVCSDADTYFVTNEKKTKEDIKIGDRVKLYFDKIISIRYDNYPVKIVIDHSKIAQ